MNSTFENTPLGVLARRCVPSREWQPPVTMLVLAHPGDETVGAATLLPGLNPSPLVYLTNGVLADAVATVGTGITPAEEACLRRGELLSALDRAGLPASCVEFVNAVDHETPLQMTLLVRWLEILIRDHAPEIVLTHAYEGGHPDHDTAALVVNAACRRIAATGDAPPLIGEFTSCHDGAVDGSCGTFLPGAEDAVLIRRLSAEERRMKRQLLGCYVSRRAVFRQVLLEFERFRVAPAYDFLAAPHSGPLRYERSGLAGTGMEWRQRAREALRELDLLPPSSGAVELAAQG